MEDLRSSFDNALGHVVPETYSALPDVPGVPGDIIGVWIAHGWASQCGYYEIVEIHRGLARKTYATERVIEAAALLSRLPEPVSAPFDDGPLSPLHVILQNIRYCATGRSDDVEAPLPVTDDATSMRIAYKAWTGEIRELAIHADPERGTDAGSKAAKRILEYVEHAFGNKRVIDALLVIHRWRRFATVAMNGNLFASIGPNAKPACVIDGENDDLLEVGATMKGGHLCLELRVVNLQSGWKSHKAMIEVQDKAVVRLAPSDFIFEGPWGYAVAIPKDNPRPGFPEPEEWIVACAAETFLHEQNIDVDSVLPGFELVDEPDVYHDPAVQVNADLSVTGFDHPFPETAELEQLAFDLPPRYPGAVKSFRSLSDHLVYRKTQLDEQRLYFLTEYLKEDGTPTGRYSFDMEGAHDSHYSFNTDGAARLRRMMDVTSDAPLAPAMVEYARAHGGDALSQLVWRIKTGSMSY